MLTDVLGALLGFSVVMLLFSLVVTWLATLIMSWRSPAPESLPLLLVEQLSHQFRHWLAHVRQHGRRGAKLAPLCETGKGVAGGRDDVVAGRRVGGRLATVDPVVAAGAASAVGQGRDAQAEREDEGRERDGA